MDLTAASAELAARGFDHLSSGRKTIFLNLGKNAFEQLAPWPWLEVTTSGAAPLTISDVRQVLYVVDSTNRVVLPGLDVRTTVESDPLLTAGTPSSWWLDGLTTLRVHPTNTGSVSVRYLKHSPELASGSDTPLIPVREHPVWIDFAVVEAYKDSDNYPAAQTLLGDLMSRQVPRLLDTYLGRNLANPEYQVTNAWFHDDA